MSGFDIRNASYGSSKDKICMASMIYNYKNINLASNKK